MSFSGFKTVRYPLYTVVTPQTGDTYEVRTLNVSEVLKIRDSLITRNKIPKIINNIIWDALESKPDHIKNKDMFLRNLTVNDRDALVYGLYYSTFGSDKVYNVTCDACNNTQKIKLKLDNIYNVNNYPGNKSIKNSYRLTKAKNPSLEPDPIIENAIKLGSKIRKQKIDVDIPPAGMPSELARLEYSEFFKLFDAGEIDMDGNYIDSDDVTNNKNIDNTLTESVELNSTPQSNEEESSDILLSETDAENLTDILEKVIKIVLPVTNVVCYIKQPTVYDESNLFEDLAYNNQSQLDLASDTLIIDRFEEYDGDRLVQVIDNKNDIIEAFQLLPYKDRSEIVKLFSKEFGQYDVALKNTWQCLSCSTVNNLELDIVNQFFRAIAAGS